MNNYSATEIGLTKHTKALLANKPIQFCKPAHEFAPLVRQDNKKIIMKKKPAARKKRTITSRMSDEQIERFQQTRMFAVIRGMN